MNTLIQYFKDSYNESKKVTWPTKQEITSYTLLVVGVSLTIAAFLGSLDYIFNIALEKSLNI